jgi:hypothetical protein
LSLKQKSNTIKTSGVNFSTRFTGKFLNAHIIHQCNWIRGAMKLSHEKIIYLNIILALSGLFLVAVGIILSGSWLQILFEAVGTSLIATGLVNFVDKFFHESKTDSISIISIHRAQINRSLYDEKYNVRRVDILGISITNVLKEFIRDPEQQIIERVLKQNLRLRLNFIHPETEYLEHQRAIEDHISWETLHSRQIKSVEMVVLFYKMLLDAYRKENTGKLLRTGSIGSVEINLLHCCPYISIFRADEKIYWGLYTSNKTGEASPLFLTEKQEEEGMFEVIKEHYYGLLNNEKDPDNSYLVKFIIKDNEPILNIPLAEKLLGKERLDELLK